MFSPENNSREPHPWEPTLKYKVGTFNSTVARIRPAPWSPWEPVGSL